MPVIDFLIAFYNLRIILKAMNLSKNFNLRLLTKRSECTHKALRDVGHLIASGGIFKCINNVDNYPLMMGQIILHFSRSFGAFTQC